MAQYLTPDVLNLAPNSTYRLMAQQSAAMAPKQTGATGDWSEEPVDPYLALKNNVPTLQAMNQPMSIQDALLSNTAAQKKLIRESRARQLEGISEMEKNVAAAEAQRPGFQGVDLAPLLAFTDSLSGNRTAAAYTAPKTNEQRNKEAVSLKQALLAQKNQITENDLKSLQLDQNLQLGLAQLQDQKNKTKAPTADQFKVAGYAHAMRQAEEVLSNLAKAGYNRADRSEQLSTFLPGELQDENLRKYEQAEKNFVTSILRRRSGATITPTEIALEKEKYFPRPGDSADVIAQKAALRQQEMNSFMAESGDAYNMIQPVGGLPQQQISPSGPPPGWKRVGDEWVKE